MHKEAAPANSEKTFSEAQKRYQRLLLRDKKDQSIPGDGLKRAGLNLTILAGATAADLGESHLIDTIMRHPLEKRYENTAQAIERDFPFDPYYESRKPETETPPAIVDVYKEYKKELDGKMGPAKLAQGIAWGADFVEEWATDSLYSGIANAWVRKMTGVDDATYVSETAAFVSEWGNFITQVFFGNRLFGKTQEGHGGKIEPRKWHGIKLAYWSMDFVNPVNVEATRRLLEELPGLGDGFGWLFKHTDHALETAKLRIANSAAAKFVSGFHIGKNLKPVA